MLKMGKRGRGGQASPQIHIALLRTRDCVPWNGKRDFASMSQLRLLQMGGGSLGSPAYQVKTGFTPCEYPNAEGCRGSQAEDGGQRGKGVTGGGVHYWVWKGGRWPWKQQRVRQEQPW